MRRRNLGLMIGVVLFSTFLAGICQAAVLLDTGPGPSSGDAWFLDSIHRGLAGKFTTTQTWTIGSLEAWIKVDAAGPVRAAIYNHDAASDLPGSVRFSQTFTPATSAAAGWQGVSGLNWSLPPGTYWVGLEVQAIGFQGILYYPAAHPLSRYAFYVMENPWDQFFVDLGFRLQTPSQAPPALNAIDLLLGD